MQEVIERINRQIKALQVIAALAVFFIDGYNVEWNCISAHIYQDYGVEGGPIPRSAKEKLIQAMNAIHLLIGGTIEKIYTDDYLRVILKGTKEYDGIQFNLSVARKNVCTRVVKGTEMKEVPDYSNVPKVMVEREIVEWECDPLLAATND